MACLEGRCSTTELRPLAAKSIIAERNVGPEVGAAQDYLPACPRLLWQSIAEPPRAMKASATSASICTAGKYWSCATAERSGPLYLEEIMFLRSRLKAWRQVKKCPAARVVHCMKGADLGLDLGKGAHGPIIGACEWTDRLEFT